MPVLDVSPSRHEALVVHVWELWPQRHADRGHVLPERNVPVNLEKREVVEVLAVFLVDFDLDDLVDIGRVGLSLPGVLEPQVNNQFSWCKEKMEAVLSL